MPNQGCSANKKVWERTQKNILKQLQTHFKAKCGKGMGTRSRPTKPSGVTRGWQGGRNSPGAESLWGRRTTAVSAKKS